MDDGETKLSGGAFQILLLAAATGKTVVSEGTSVRRPLSMYGDECPRLNLKALDPT